MTSTSPDPDQAAGSRLQSAYDRLGIHNVDSLATLSDGVFAIAMTLLVLDLKLPATEPSIRNASFRRRWSHSRRAF
jgi:hypothetical protein